MMAPVPLRSAMAVGCADDTSLALPSDNKLRTGQQRVLDQVFTIKRSKSKHGKSGSPTVSPTSLTLQSSTTSSEFGGFKFSPSKTNGSFSRVASNQSSGFSNAINSRRSRSLYTKNSTGRHFSSSGAAELQVNTSRWPQSPTGLKPSRSDPILDAKYSLAPKTSMKAKGQTAVSQQTLQPRGHSVHVVTNGAQMTSSQTRMVRPSSVHSHTDGRMGTMKLSKATGGEMQSAENSTANMSAMTLKEAVMFLSHDDNQYKQCGANYIQYITCKEEEAKREVSDLGGIPLLVALLRSPSPSVSRGAAGALRNLVFMNQCNKLEVQNCGGIGKALQLLKETDSDETKSQITGLLWNLSSNDQLKEELMTTAMPVLTENVLVPFTTQRDNINPDVFCNATGCLRNLSNGHKNVRTSMRDCEGLIDSLVKHLQTCWEKTDPSEKSVENCACILHNLSYKLGEETDCFQKLKLMQKASKTSSAIGCFSPKSSKAQNDDFSQKFLEEKKPSGSSWLGHREIMSIYLYLMEASNSEDTQEACCGALQNLTASKGPEASVVSHMLVKKLDVQEILPNLIESNSPRLQKSVLSLLSNLCRVSDVQASMAKEVLPSLSSLLTSQTPGMTEDTLVSVCNTAHTLILSDVNISKKTINDDMLTSLIGISKNKTMPKASTAAASLLYNMWNEKNLHHVLKKNGMTKSLFKEIEEVLMPPKEVEPGKPVKEKAACVQEQTEKA